MSSAKMQPMDHMSTAVEYSVAPSNSSGDLMAKSIPGQIRMGGKSQYTQQTFCYLFRFEACDSSTGTPDAPIPQRDDELRHVPQRIAKLPGEPKVGDLDHAAVVHEQVTRLEITMKDPVGMTMSRG